jgi:hypothetical protein
MASTKEWRDYNPELNTARYTPFAQHPQVVDQPVLTSWNNRQAPGYAGADSNLFSSVYRSQMLDRQLALRLKGGHKLTLPEMVDAMEQAGSTDLRGMTSLPLALRILGTRRTRRSRRPSPSSGRGRPAARIASTATATGATTTPTRCGSWTPGGPSSSRRCSSR